MCTPYIYIFQEQELLVRISDLQSEVCSRSNRITDLDHEIHSLNETIDTLTRELELKGKEVLRVRSEANHQIRYITPKWYIRQFRAKHDFMIRGDRTTPQFSKLYVKTWYISYVNILFYVITTEGAELTVTQQ